MIYFASPISFLLRIPAPNLQLNLVLRKTPAGVKFFIVNY